MRKQRNAWESVGVRTRFKIFYGEIKHKGKKSNISGLRLWSTLVQLFCNVFYLTLSFSESFFPCLILRFFRRSGHEFDCHYILPTRTHSSANRLPNADKTFSQTSCCPEGCCSTKEPACWCSILMLLPECHIKFTSFIRQKNFFLTARSALNTVSEN